uniref:Rad60-SLD domain-containing protein n=1 Tax=Steinernema glaseri TaxID=37863 RepID=A0A1I7YW80_9BILA
MNVIEFQDRRKDRIRYNIQAAVLQERALRNDADLTKAPPSIRHLLPLRSPLLYDQGGPTDALPDVTKESILLVLEDFLTRWSGRAVANYLQFREIHAWPSEEFFEVDSPSVSLDEAVELGLFIEVHYQEELVSVFDASGNTAPRTAEIGEGRGRVKV